MERNILGMLYCKIINEGNIPFDKKSFSGWILPSGRFEEVPFLEHVEYMRKTFTELPLNIGPIEYYKHAFSKGYTRVTYSMGDLNIESGSREKAIEAIDNFFPLFKENKRARVTIEWNMKHRTFNLPTDNDEFFKFIR